MPVIAHQVSANGYEDFERLGYLKSYCTTEDLLNGINDIVKSNVPSKKIIEAYDEYIGYKSGLSQLMYLTRKYNLV
jgi:hypothetical protein